MEKKVLYSDLSGDMIQGPDDHAVVTVESHPDLEQPVHLDARPGELERVEELSIEAVSLKVELPGEQPTVHILPVEQFNELAGEGMEMEAILAGATPAIRALAARRNHNRRSDGGPLINYGKPEYAGMPHKGKVGDDEKRIVQDSLDEVNARLTAQGIRPIDPANPEHAERYGLKPTESTADASPAVPGTDPSVASTEPAAGDTEADPATANQDADQPAARKRRSTRS